MGENIKILLLEDNPGDAYLIEEHLEEFASFSYEFKNVGTLNEALTVLKKQPYDVILLDLELPDSYGINTFLNIYNKNPLIPIIILTGLNDEKIRSYALKKGASDYLVKGQTKADCWNVLHNVTLNIRKLVLYYLMDIILTINFRL